MMNTKAPHTLGLSYLETVYGDLDQILSEYEDDFIWLDEILEACKKALVTPDVELLPKTPSFKKTRSRIIRKPQSDVEDRESDADDEDQTPPSRSRRLRQKSTKTSNTNNSRASRSTRSRKNTNDISMESPRENITPKASSKKALKLSECSQLELSDTDMTPVPAKFNTSVKIIKSIGASPVIKSSVRERASAYESMIKRTSSSPAKRTPNQSFITPDKHFTPERHNTPDTVKHVKTTSVLSKISTDKRQSISKRSSSSHRRSSRKSLKVLSTKLKRQSSQGYSANKLSIPNHVADSCSSEEVEEPKEDKKKPRTRLRLKKKDNSETRQGEESETTENESESRSAYQSPVRTPVKTPVPKPRTTITPKSTPVKQANLNTTMTIVEESDDGQTSTPVKKPRISSKKSVEKEQQVSETEEVMEVGESSDEKSDNKRSVTNEDRDSGISGILSAQTSAVSLKNLEVEGSKGRSSRSGVKNIVSSPIVESSDGDNSVFIENTMNESKRKRSEDSEEVKTVSRSKRSCVGSLNNVAEMDEDKKEATKQSDSDEYESMEDSDDEKTPPAPRAKIVKPVVRKAVTTPNRPSNLVGGFVHSFIKRNTPVKPAVQSIDQKQKEILDKERKNELRLQKKKEMVNDQMKERKRLREERMEKVRRLREEQEKRDLESKKQNILKQDERFYNIDKIEEKNREERVLKEKCRQQKQKILDEKRLKEEEEYINHLKQEQEEKDKRIRDMLQKKKENAEQSRLKRLAEQKEEERLAKERREKEMKEREHQEKIDREARIQKEMAKLQELEKARLAKIAEMKEQQKAEQKAKIAAANAAAAAQKAKMNTTMDKSENNPKSYMITPDKKHKDNSSNQDYNINDLNSDDSTDEEDAPRKKIPIWATGNNLKAALINQEYHPPKLDEIFSVVPDLDLNDLFVKRKPRFNKRTSSAVWDSPMLKPCEAAQFHV